jgi:hypothetical protein
LQTEAISSRRSSTKKKKNGFFGSITKIFKKKEIIEVKRSSSEGNKYKLTGGVLMTEPSYDSKEQKKKSEKTSSPKHHPRSRSDAISDADDLVALYL